MRGAPAADRQAGFTLIELLVALVVLGLLMVGLGQGVRAGLALRHAQTQRLGETADLDAVMRLLRTLLTRLPVTADGNGVIPTASGAGFAGEPDQVRFVGDLPTGLGTTRRAEIALHVDDRRLILAWTPHRHEHRQGGPPQPTQTVLLRGVERLEFAYWGATGDGQPGAWQARWDGSTLPELIRLHVVFGKDDHRHWPDLMTTPRP